MKPPMSLWDLRRAARRARSQLIARFARDVNPDPAASVLVLGTARSGTTWFGDVLAAGLGARVLFEPFRSEEVVEARQFGTMPYRPPDADDPALEAFVRSIVTGRLRGSWVDREARQLVAHARVVKSVRANLLAAWVRRRFAIPVFLLIRDPVAVVRSFLAAGWSARADVRAMLASSALVRDHLGDEAGWAGGLEHEAERAAYLWCVHQRVGLAHAEDDAGLTPLFFEDLRRDPGGVLPKVFGSLGALIASARDSRSFAFGGSGGGDPAIDATRRGLATVDRPSTTAGRTGTVVFSRGQGSGSASDAAAAAEIADRVLAVVARCGLEWLYDGQGNPSPVARDVIGAPGPTNPARSLSPRSRSGSGAPVSERTGGPV